jgi:copper chaperone CopZ
MSPTRSCFLAILSLTTMHGLSACSSSGPKEGDYEERPITHEVSAADLAAVRDKTPIADTGATLYVNGLGCPLCASNIDKQLVRVRGVKKVTVDLSIGKVTVEFKDSPRPSPYQLENAVADAGFTLVKIEKYTTAK